MSVFGVTGGNGRWTRLALVAIFLAPLGIGLWLALHWLIGAGPVVLFLFILGLWEHEWQRLQRRREVRENMRRILAERRERERQDED